MHVCVSWEYADENVPINFYFELFKLEPQLRKSRHEPSF
jgi:hypothetical protein